MSNTKIIEYIKYKCDAEDDQWAKLFATSKSPPTHTYLTFEEIKK